jgi:hypothetical protein
LLACFAVLCCAVLVELVELSWSENLGTRFSIGLILETTTTTTTTSKMADDV